MYCSLAQKRKGYKEQILDRVASHPVLDVQSVPIYIHTADGSIAKSYSLAQKDFIIRDTLSHDTPNVIRRALHDIVNQKARSSTTYEIIKQRILEECTLPEDYGIKSSDGLTMNFKVSNDWITFGSDELRELRVDSLNYETIFDIYGPKLIHPALQSII
jgi:hypothetical protein